MKVYRSLEDFDKDADKVITIGSFDGLHKGHVQIIEQVKLIAKDQNCASCVVTFDPHPRQLLYPKDSSMKLLTTLDEKIQILDSLGVDMMLIVPFTIEFSQMSAREYLDSFIFKVVKPKVFVLGYDHRFGNNRLGSITMLEEYESEDGFSTYEIPQYLVEENKVSSTVIRNSLLSGDIQRANNLLGRPYKLSGKVVHGEKMGERLGYKTANLDPQSPDKIVPANGIYAVSVGIEGLIFEGMLYIGTKPTFHEEETTFIEVNIFNFDGYIYGKTLDLFFHKFLRKDMKFDSREELTAQMDLDKEDTLSYFAQEKTSSAT